MSGSKETKLRYLLSARCHVLRWGYRALYLVLSLLVISACTVQASPGPAPPPQAPTRVLAYYYIWYNASSWNRAKSDYPLIGRYSSDETVVMRQHVLWAKAVGIDGFIVSWKSTDVLNSRLEKLIDIAAEEEFKLAIIYQGLDFDREPLPPERIADDLDFFQARYANNEVFNIFGKPLIIWSGTWEFSREEIAEVVSRRREWLLILASERNVEGYERVADIVDGNAYYWSSVDPETHRGYEDKLVAMSQSVHASHGLWIAPAAPGFDATLLGGSRVVDRKDGETLRREMDAAIKSSPDAIGLISWNEFSENSHIEPSQQYGTRYLEVMADILGGSIPAVPDFDSSEPAATSFRNGLPMLGAFLILLAAIPLITLWRRRQPHPDSADSSPGHMENDGRLGKPW